MFVGISREGRTERAAHCPAAGFCAGPAQKHEQKDLWQRMRKHLQKGLQQAELVVDAHEVGIARSVIRLTTNVTARRTVLPEHHRGRKTKIVCWCDRWLARIKAARWQPPHLTKHTTTRPSHSSGCARRLSNASQNRCGPCPKTAAGGTNPVERQAHGWRLPAGCSHSRKGRRLA